MMKKNNIKIVMTILVFLLIMLISTIVYLLTSNSNNDVQNTLSSENIVADEDVEKNTILEEKTYKALTKAEDVYTYFIVKNCINSLYNHSLKEDTSLKFVDNSVIDYLNLKQDNFINKDSSGFRIDEIYEQSIKEDEKIYVVYYRLAENPESVINSVAWVRVSTKNQLFSLYPYEYLKEKEYLNYKEGQVIDIDFSNEIQKNELNTYEIEEEIDAKKCMKELFSRYKFDLLLDREHLYNTLDSEYRDKRFKNIEDFEQYINDNKTDMYVESIKTYKADNKDEYIRYVGITEKDNYYIFYVNSLMEYTVYLDNYTISTSQDVYKASFPNVQAKYCIERVIQAINDKNYEFVYEKLNPIQKNNYYRNIDDFKEFILNHFYDKNNYEIDDEYSMISSNVYQYNVKITDATEQEFTYRILKMSVTLKDDTNFEISIVNQ